MPEKCLFVVNGGHLLRTVVWPTLSTYGDVCQSYISYTLKHYGAGSTVIFDGYGCATSIKVVQQRQRAQRRTSNDVIFYDNTPTTTSQAAFLANSHNKKRLIHVSSVCPSVHLSNACIVTKRKKHLYRFLHHMKDHLSLFF